MRLDAVGLGNAITDALVRIDDDSVLAQLGVDRGVMTPVDHGRWHDIFERVSHLDMEIAAGGSCANTISALGYCGAEVLYCGQVGDDAFGEQYARLITEACGRHALVVAAGDVSGKCLSLISHSDGERTMITDLGAAGKITGLGGFAERIGDARVLHLEGYALLGGNIREALFAAVATAESVGTAISLDCADPFVARMVGKDVEALIRDHANIAFLNREEAELVTGKGAHAAIDVLRDWTDVIVVKLGAEGSLVAMNGEVVHVPAFPVNVVDTTGAGDSYAGGFLYGWLNGWTPRQCGELGSRIASATVGQLGAVVRDRARIRQLVLAVEAG